jgi:predicted nucleic acid-binding protein
MRYLLDTDALSNLLKRGPSTALIARLAVIAPEEQCTSSITVGELVYEASRWSDGGLALRERIENMLLADLRVVPFDADAARRYGVLRAELERRGTPLAEADLRIAAIALARSLTIVTGNVRHFERVPELTVENWLG